MILLKARQMFDIVSKLPKRGKLFGLDVGEKYIGVAVSDNEHRLAYPLRVMHRIGEKQQIRDVSEEMSDLVTEHSTTGVVVGWPMYQGKPTTGLVHVQSFLNELSKNPKLYPLYFTKWDESFTSRNVALLIKELQFPAKVDKAIRDEFAAVGILQEFMDAMNLDDESDK